MKHMHNSVALQYFFVLMHNLSEWTSWWVTWLSVPFVYVPSDLSLPTPSFKNSQYFLCPFFPVYPALLPLLLPLPLILLMSLSTTISLITVPLHPSSCMHHPPLLFTPPVISIKAAIRFSHGYLHIPHEQRSYLCYSRQPCFVRV